MSLTIKEHAKITVAVKVERRLDSGAVVLTIPERRILDGNRALVAGFDWAAATWDSTINRLSTLFDSTLAGLNMPGTYFVQLRGTIGTERYVAEVKVVLEESGP